MRPAILVIIAALLSFGAPAAAQSQEKQPTPEEMAAKEAERLESLLSLETWQVFYVDSTLQHDYAAMQAELGELQRAKVENYDLYIDIRDKWMEQIDRTYKKYFTPDQWTKYLKSGAARAQKARDKRKAKAEGKKK
jgi:hypothetical protein